MPTHARQSVSSLEREVAVAVSEVRDAFAGLLSGLPPCQKPAELRRALGIDYTMSWKTMRIVDASDPMSVVLEVPRPGSLSRMLRASAKKGIDQTVLDRLERAVDEFESLARRHAGDRPTFDALLSSLSPDAAHRTSVEATRTMYRNSVRVLGRQVDTTAMCLVIRRDSKNPALLEVVWLMAKLGIKRFHAAAPLGLFNARATVCRPDGVTVWRNLSLEGDSPYEEGPLLLEEFSSKPLPAMRVIRDAQGQSRVVVFESPEVGLQSSIDCVAAQVMHATPPSVDDVGRLYEWHDFTCRVPTALLLLDIFVHENVTDRPASECLIVDPTFTGGPIPYKPDPAYMMAQQIQPRAVGRGFRAARCPQVPRYEAMLEFIFDRMRWTDPDQFHLLRCRVEYPVLGSTVVHRLPITP